MQHDSQERVELTKGLNAIRGSARLRNPWQRVL